MKKGMGVMTDMDFKHNDLDSCCDKTLTLHNCVVEKMDYCDGTLRFVLPEGFWITRAHPENPLGRSVRTDEAVVDFPIRKMDDITIRVFTRDVYKNKKVVLWKMRDLMKAVNNGECTLELLAQYRTYFEIMWRCVIHSKKKPCDRECQLHLPETSAVFRWNDLRPDCQ
ncbi:MAG: hypothetical protein ACI3W5_05665 [Faecousia sp.]